MKFSRLVTKLSELLSADKRRQREKRDKLKTLLKTMKSQQRELESSHASSGDPATRADIALKLQILTEQRRKGVQLHRELAGKPPRRK